MDQLNYLPGGVVIAILLFALVMSVLWFLLPFAVFGIKGRLDRLILLQELTMKSAGVPLPKPEAEEPISPSMPRHRRDL